MCQLLGRGKKVSVLIDAVVNVEQQVHADGVAELGSLFVNPPGEPNGFVHGLRGDVLIEKAVQGGLIPEHAGLARLPERLPVLLSGQTDHLRQRTSRFSRDHPVSGSAYKGPLKVQEHLPEEAQQQLVAQRGVEQLELPGHPVYRGFILPEAEVFQLVQGFGRRTHQRVPLDPVGQQPHGLGERQERFPSGAEIALDVPADLLVTVIHVHRGAHAGADGNVPLALQPQIRQPDGVQGGQEIAAGFPERWELVAVSVAAELDLCLDDVEDDLL